MSRKATTGGVAQIDANRALDLRFEFQKVSVLRVRCEITESSAPGPALHPVIPAGPAPAKAGGRYPRLLLMHTAKSWIPAFAGMTGMDADRAADDAVISQRTLSGLMADSASCLTQPQREIQLGSPVHAGVMQVKLARRIHNMIPARTRCSATPPAAEVGR